MVNDLSFGAVRALSKPSFDIMPNFPICQGYFPKSWLKQPANEEIEQLG
jgi:hypothetical protein